MGPTKTEDSDLLLATIRRTVAVVEILTGNAAQVPTAQAPAPVIRRRRPRSTIDVDLVRELVAQGFSDKVVAERLGKSVAAIEKCRRRAGIRSGWSRQADTRVPAARDRGTMTCALARHLFVNGGADRKTIARAFGVPLCEVRRMTAGLAHAQARHGLDETTPPPDIDALWPILRRIRPQRTTSVGRPEVPAADLRSRIHDEIARLEVELEERRAEYREACGDDGSGGVSSARYVADRARNIEAGLEHYPTIAAQRGQLLQFVDALPEAKAARDLAQLVRKHVRALEVHVLDLEPGPRQELRHAIERAEGDLYYARGAARSFESGAARSWLAMDVASTGGFLSRDEWGDLTDEQVQRIASEWGWTDSEPTADDLAAIEAAPVDLDDDSDDLDPVLDEWSAPARSGAWEPIDHKLRSPLVTKTQELTGARISNARLSRMRPSPAWPVAKLQAAPAPIEYRSDLDLIAAS